MPMRSKTVYVLSTALKLEVVTLGACLLVGLINSGIQSSLDTSRREAELQLIQDATPYLDMTTAEWLKANPRGDTVAYGIPQVDLANGFVNLAPNTDAAIVERLYEGVLDRKGTPLDIGGWVDAVHRKAEGGKSGGLQAIAEAVVSSPEAFKGHGREDNIEFIKGIYARMTGNSALADDVDKWSAVMRRDGMAGRAAFALSVARSREAMDHLALRDMIVVDPDMSTVFHIYRSILGRNPDKEGMVFWRKSLHEGMTPSEVAAYFLTSSEYGKRSLSDVDFIRAVYREWLGREPDSQGQAAYSGLVTQTGGRAAMVGHVAASPEARARLLQQQ